MAIIKTLRLQAFILLGFLGAAQGVAVKPTFKAAQDSNDLISGAKAACDKDLELRCQSTEANRHFAFNKDGADPTKWSTVVVNADTDHTDSIGMADMDVLNSGTWTCRAAEDDAGAQMSIDSAETVVVECKKCGSTNDCTDERFKCTPGSGGGTANTCGCKYGVASGSFDPNTPTNCKECDAATNAGCTTNTAKARCDAGTCTTCNATVGCTGNKPYCKDNACEDCVTGTKTGCTANPAKPYCKAAGSPCEGCDQHNGKPCNPATETCEPSGECKSKTTTAASPPTQGSGGTTQTDGGATDSKGTTGKADTTSSAGTVTSTACLVIASVVLALMI